MPTYNKSIDVAVPVRTAYDQWTQFESFPEFMDGVEQIVQLDDTTTHWVTTIGGVHREFDAKITEQQPDERVAWTRTERPGPGGRGHVPPAEPDTTRVHLQLDWSRRASRRRSARRWARWAAAYRATSTGSRSSSRTRGEQTGGWRGTVEPSPQDNQAIGHTPDDH